MLDAKIERKMSAGAGAIGALIALLRSGQLANSSEKTRECVRELIAEWFGAPHPQHCHHPEKCNDGRCKRDPVCIE
jgi:hypothetical protein